MRVLLTCVLLCVATGASALSCVPPDVVRSYKAFAASETRYTIVVGKLTFREKRLPVVDWDKQDQVPPLTAIPARLEGRSLQLDGFTGRYARNVMLNVECLGPWCAGGTSGMEQLFFVNVDGAKPSVTLSPCGGSTFEASPKSEARVLACFRGETCEEGAMR